MKSTHTWKLAAAAVATCALLGPSLASAALPRPNHALVTPFRSIGKIRLGIAKTNAFAVWGTTSLCSVGTGGRVTCDWLSPAPTDFPEEGGVLELKGGEVCGMLMRAGTDAVHGSLTITRLKHWKTSGAV